MITRGSTRPASVLLVDDEPDLRRLMHLALQPSEQFEVVGECGTGTSAVELAGQLRPDIVLLDLLMPELDGRRALPAILACSPCSMVVVLSALQAQEEAEPMLAKGAFAYLEKTELGADFVTTLETLFSDFRRALEGETVVAPSSTWRPAGA